jgi:leucyl aminopeptidase
VADLPFGAEFQRIYTRARLQGSAQVLSFSPENSNSAVLVVGIVDKKASVFERLVLAGKLWKEAAKRAPRSLVLTTLGLSDADAAQGMETLLAASLAGAAPMPSFKSKPEKRPEPESFTVLHRGSRPDFSQTLATHAGNHLARWLTTLPPNQLDCLQYRDTLRQLAKREGWQFQFFGISALRRLGAGAFLAVARANRHQDAGIVKLSYRAAKSAAPKRKLALVGKGVCFDTGGINLKSHKSMYDMHTDMQGSAVAAGTLLALSELDAAFDIDCWLAITENEIGPNAYRPQEVVTALNGMTIQVVHSDAEGRMALADTLTLASREKPDLILDFATLTGACVAALTERMSGAFTNRPEWHALIEKAGRDSGERVWNFPMDADFEGDLDSPIADIMQCTMDNKGDHILAARFLQRFIAGEAPWIHIDLSSGSRSGGLAHIPTEITGFGVRFASTLLLHSQLLSEPARSKKRAS